MEINFLKKVREALAMKVYKKTTNNIFIYKCHILYNLVKKIICAWRLVVKWKTKIIIKIGKS